MAILSSRQKAHVAAYAYKPGMVTALDDALDPFWNSCAAALPLWLAPNLVTLSGLVLNVASAAVLLAYNPRFAGLAPTGCYVAAAGCLIAYQTLDAIDGKQARRTGSSSPLGQLFDHGCDAISLVCVILLTLAACFAEVGLLAVVTVNVMSLGFYVFQWEEYHSGVLNISNGTIGITEGQWLLAMALVIAPHTGPGFWHAPLWGVAGATPMLLGLALMTIQPSTMMAETLGRVLRAAPGGSQTPEERGDKVLGRKDAWLQLLPPLGVAALSLLWLLGKEAHNRLRARPLFFVCSVGLSHAMLTTYMIVSHMAKSPLPWGRMVAAPGLPLLFLASRPFREVCHVGLALEWHEEPVVAFCALVLAHATYVLQVIHELCDHLGIQCLRIPPPDAIKKGR